MPLQAFTCKAYHIRLSALALSKNGDATSGY